MSKKSLLIRLRYAVQVADEGPKTAFKEPVYTWLAPEYVDSVCQTLAELVGRPVRLTLPQQEDTRVVEHTPGKYFKPIKSKV